MGKSHASQYANFGSLLDIVLLLFSISAQNKSEDVFYLILTDEASYFFCINPLNAVG